MIFEALSTLKDRNGSDIGVILNFIEVRWMSLVICYMSYSIYLL